MLDSPVLLQFFKRNWLHSDGSHPAQFKTAGIEGLLRDKSHCCCIETVLMHHSIDCNFETSCSQTALIRRTSFQLDGSYRVLTLQISNFFRGFILLDIPILAAV